MEKESKLKLLKREERQSRKENTKESGKHSPEEVQVKI